MAFAALFFSRERRHSARAGFSSAGPRPFPMSFQCSGHQHSEQYDEAAHDNQADGGSESYLCSGERYNAIIHDKSKRRVIEQTRRVGRNGSYPLPVVGLENPRNRTLRQLCSKGRCGSEVAVEHPRMDFIA